MLVNAHHHRYPLERRPLFQCMTVGRSSLGSPSPCAEGCFLGLTIESTRDRIHGSSSCQAKSFHHCVLLAVKAANTTDCAVRNVSLQISTSSVACQQERSSRSPVSGARDSRSELRIDGGEVIMTHVVREFGDVRAQPGQDERSNPTVWKSCVLSRGHG